MKWGNEFLSRGTECSEETDRCLEEEDLRQWERKLQEIGQVLGGEVVDGLEWKQDFELNTQLNQEPPMGQKKKKNGNKCRKYMEKVDKIKYQQ